MLAYILALLFAVLVISIMFWCLSRDFRYARLYRRVPRSMGTVTEITGSEKVHFYSRYQWRNYTRVKVQFYAQDREYNEELLLKGGNIHQGDRCEVHYFIDREGQIFVLNDIPVRRLCEFGIACLIAIPLCAALIFLKKQGVF